MSGIQGHSNRKQMCVPLIRCIDLLAGAVGMPNSGSQSPCPFFQRVKRSTQQIGCLTASETTLPARKSYTAPSVESQRNRRKRLSGEAGFLRYFNDVTICVC